MNYFHYIYNRLFRNSISLDKPSKSILGQNLVYTQICDIKDYQNFITTYLERDISNISYRLKSTIKYPNKIYQQYK